MQNFFIKGGRAGSALAGETKCRLYGGTSKGKKRCSKRISKHKQVL